MKTQFYQSTKRAPKQVTALDLAKGFGYVLAAFTVAVGFVYALGFLGWTCEWVLSLIK